MSENETKESIVENEPSENMGENETNEKMDENETNENMDVMNSNDNEFEPTPPKENIYLTRKKVIKYTLIYLISSLIYFLILSLSKLGKFKGEVTISESIKPLWYVMILSIIIGLGLLVLLVIDIINEGFIKRLSASFQKIVFTIIDWFSVLPICIIITVFCFSYLFIITPVEGESMNPTIQDGEHVFVSYMTKVKAGSVVVLEVNENDNAHVYGTSYYIKRVVGVPGDTVEWKEGQLYISGVAKDYLSDEVLDNFHITGSDDFAKEDIFYMENGEKIVPDNYVIPEGYYFVMGDNRNSGKSHDSRRIGLIKEENIIGVATNHMYFIIPRGKIE